jgi:preprotein translocase subunit SecG
MINFLLIIHICIVLLLIMVILLQRPSKDGLAGISSASGGSNLFSTQAAGSFLSKLTMVLAGLFIMSSLVLANLSNKLNDSEVIIEKIEEIEEIQTAPIIE